MLIALLLVGSANPAGAAEYRAFWVDAWGAGFLNQSQVDNLLGVVGDPNSKGTIRDANCNMVIVQASRRFDVCYPSGVGEPYMSGLTPSNFNALEAMIKAAHDTTGGKERVEVHCWSVAFKTDKGTVYYQHDDTPTGSLTTFDNYWPTRISSTTGAETAGGAFDPGHPKCLEYLVNAHMDLVNFQTTAGTNGTDGHIDGIHYDYIRFEANTEGYNPTSVARYNARYGLTGDPASSDEQFKQWRRDQVSAFVRQMYARIQKTKPLVRQSGSFVTWNPSPATSTRAGFQATRPYYDVYSDWDSWMQEGIVDMAVPMTYYNWASLPTDYTKWMSFEKDRKFNRHMIIGPGTYLNSLANAILELQMTRDASPAGNYAQGFSGYSYRVPYASGTWSGFSPSLLAQVTPTWDDIPNMPWKSAPTKGHIMGTVTIAGTGAWADGATVSITGPTNRTMYVDGTGFYAFIDLPVGTYTVTANLSGYPSANGAVTVAVGAVTGNMYQVDLVLGANTPPSITTQPASKSVSQGANASFTVAASGTTPFYYQWRLYATNIAGATASSYTRASVQPADAGPYSVVVSNAYGTATSSNAILTVIVPPTITTQPLSQTVTQGLSATFTVDASGTMPFGYQWRLNGTNIGSATASSYTRANVQPSDAGSYSVIVSNSAGTATSSNALLAVIVPPTPPAITTQPQGQTVILGETASFNVLATGGIPLAYQWQLNGADIGGATTSVYTKANVQATDAGEYSVLVTNAYGSLLSSNATLVVDTNIPLPAITAQPQSQTVVAGQSATFTVTATNKAALSYQWQFNALPIAGATASAYTLANAQTNNAGSYSVVIANVIGATTSTDAVLTVNFSLTATADTGGSVSKSPDQTSYAPNAVVTLTATANSNYVFGGWSGDASGTNNPLSVNMTTNKTINAIFVSTIVEIGIDNTDPGWSNTSPSGSWTAGSIAEVPKIGSNYLYSAGSGSSSITRSCRWTPTITTAGFYDVYVFYQIGSNRNTNATYRVYYRGGSVSSSQNQYSATPNQGGWFLVGTNLPFAAGTGGYVELGNDSLDAKSVSADAAKFVLVTPFIPPSVTAQPQNQSIIAGAAATFSVTATGTAPLTYQWRLNGTSLTGATASSYTRSNVQPADAGSYSVVITNVAGGMTSSDAILTVNVPPSITTQPQGLTVNQSANATFTVVATGTAPLAYQWYLGGLPLADATNSVFTVTNAQPAAAGNYSVEVLNVAGQVTSSNATLTVDVPPGITAQPQSLSVSAGSNATFTVTATGTLPLTYQWRFNGTNLASETASAYTRDNAQTTDAGSYSVVVSNIAGTATSDDAVLSVTQPAPPQIDSISLTSEGQIQLQVSGAPGYYAVDAASNLTDWAELATVTNTGSSFQYLDPEANLAQRFYRVRLVP